MADRPPFPRRLKRLIERLLLIVAVWLVTTMVAVLILGPWAGGLVTACAVAWGAWEVYRALSGTNPKHHSPPAPEQ